MGYTRSRSCADGHDFPGHIDELVISLWKPVMQMLGTLFFVTPELPGLRLGHDLQQRVRPDRELPDERPIIR
jgi:hypothetical protein